MGGFEVIAPFALGLFKTATDIAGAQQRASNQRRATLLELDRERRERVRQLREATAANRARAAGAGTSGGGTLGAIERGLHARGEKLAEDARQRAALQLRQVETQRTSSLLDIAERQARQALGLYDALDRRSEGGAIQ